MKFLLIALLIFTFAFAAVAQEAIRAVPFEFSNSKTGFSMQGAFRGEYQILPESIEIKVKRADFRLLDNVPYRGSREFVSLSFGLAQRINKGIWKWTRAKESEQFSIGRIMRPLDTYSLETINFSIPKDKDADLSKLWIFAAMTCEILEPQDNAKGRGFAYSHSCKNIFTMEESKAPCDEKF